MRKPLPLFFRLAALLALPLLFGSAWASSVQGKPNPDCPQFAPWGYPQASDPKVIRRAFHLCKGFYSSYYDPATKTPLWVAHRIGAEAISGASERTDDFRQDPEIPRPAMPSGSDYARSGFDQGHMAPAKDFSALGREAMSESFLFSNILPQRPESNRLSWSALESMARFWARDRGEIYSVTGPVYADGQALALLGKSKVAAPTHLFKILIDPARGEAIAFVLPNGPIPGAPATARDAARWIEPLSRHVVSIRQIEAWTGLDFHPLLTPGSSEMVEAAPAPIWRYR